MSSSTAELARSSDVRRLCRPTWRPELEPSWSCNADAVFRALTAELRAASDSAAISLPLPLFGLPEGPHSENAGDGVKLFCLFLLVGPTGFAAGLVVVSPLRTELAKPWRADQLPVQPPSKRPFPNPCLWGIFPSLIDALSNPPLLLAPMLSLPPVRLGCGAGRGLRSLDGDSPSPSVLVSRRTRGRTVAEDRVPVFALRSSLVRFDVEGYGEVILVCRGADAHQA